MKLTQYGVTRRSWAGSAWIGLGVALVYRGIRGESYLYRKLGKESSSAEIGLVQSITIQREPHEVYAFWRRLENLPRFMRHLRSVSETNDIRSRWVAQAPVAGKTLEWESEITTDLFGELIRWRSLPNADIEHSGEVRFKPAANGRGTDVSVQLEYRPPAGGATLAAFASPVTGKMLKDEMRRLKRVLEAGAMSRQDSRTVSSHLM
jgi:uncharacterized membrane protein